MKKILLVALMAVSFSSFAATPLTTSTAGPLNQNTKVDTQSQATATNAGNAQTINFNSPSVSTNNQTIKYDGPQTINQNVNSTGTQTVINKGETTSNVNYGGTTTQNINQSGTTNVNQNVSGEQTVNNNQTISGNTTETQIVKGGTNSTMHQTFGTQKIKNTPSVSGPPLTASNDTCMGSASGSANGPGFGISVGKTYTDDNCVMLKNSRELWNMGMKAASMALMCMDKNNREALEMTGFECPQTARANGRQFTAEVNN